MAIRSDRPPTSRAAVGVPPRSTGSEAQKETKLSALVKAARHPLSAPERQLMISEAAYYIAEQRGFVTGHELEDWLLAEAQVDAKLTAG